jgi:hypothetical protein
MARPARSPVLGFNHNVRYHGRIYHVQTEDSGISHSRIFTHLFFEGIIIATKRYNYDPDAVEDQVKVEMQEMHKNILKELKRGLFDERIITHFTAMGQEPFLDQPMTIGDLPVAPENQASVGEATIEMTTMPVTEDPALSSSMSSAESFSELPAQMPPEAYLDSEAAETLAQAAQADYDPSPTATAHSMVAAPDMDEVVALDLDALPPVVDEGSEVSTSQFVNDDEMPSQAPRPFGAGVYVKRGGPSDRPFERPPSNIPLPPLRRTGTQGVTNSPPRPTGMQPQVTRPTGMNPQVTRPPVMMPRPGISPPVTRPPVVVVRPPVRPRPQLAPAAKAPPGGVVVQRTVAVGARGPVGPAGIRRPRPSIPYVVKEGSHQLVRNAGAAQVAPPVANRPVPPVNRNLSPSPQAATISDKSLDEVILAYLSQDSDGKR